MPVHPKRTCFECQAIETAARCRHCGDPICRECYWEKHICYCSCPDKDNCQCGYAELKAKERVADDLDNDALPDPSDSLSGGLSAPVVPVERVDGPEQV